MRKYIILFGVLLFLYLFRQVIFSNIITYEVTTVIPPSQPLNEQSISILNQQRFDKEIESIESAIYQTLKLTASHLEFSKHACSDDPNQLILCKKTHCVGYASLASQILKHLCFSNNLDNYSIDHVRGKVLLGNYELTGGDNSKFWQNHDFVRIQNLDNNKTSHIDASLYEFFRFGMIDY